MHNYSNNYVPGKWTESVNVHRSQINAQSGVLEHLYCSSQCYCYYRYHKLTACNCSWWFSTHNRDIMVGWQSSLGNYLHMEYSGGWSWAVVYVQYPYSEWECIRGHWSVPFERFISADTRLLLQPRPMVLLLPEDSFTRIHLQPHSRRSENLIKEIVKWRQK